MSKPKHVVPRPEGWGVISEGASKAGAIYPTQQEAIKAGERAAKHQGTELFIHGRNGQIRERNTYGSDPFPPRG